ncbi:hypothetical protein OH77DRAFT_1422152 [Trametes cingulata]|nr:hypothetical protein OH77DRAFT_1422152 [Trametes cingulata]
MARAICVFAMGGQRLVSLSPLSIMVALTQRNLCCTSVDALHMRLSDVPLARVPHPPRLHATFSVRPVCLFSGHASSTVTQLLYV